MVSAPRPHDFHIPVMGLGYTLDTPLKIARFGISSVVSIMDDHLVEDMRETLYRNGKIPFERISEDEYDHRAKRICQYLNFINNEIEDQITTIRLQSFERDAEINKYFQLLRDGHPLKEKYVQMFFSEGEERRLLQEELRKNVVPGSIDVNIMTKLDKTNYDKDGNELPRMFSDALASLRGFATSKISGSVVFSAGMNPSLFSHTELYDDFFPDQNGKIKKGIIIKVSDYRSALIQGKYLAQKGLWVSEFRIESGLNCGGHAFATEGLLAGPILQSFADNRVELDDTIRVICNSALSEKGKHMLPKDSKTRITYQGGIGTSEENDFLMSEYGLDGTGWGSPFLLVPEATSVDDETLDILVNARQEDYYLSNASPLGVPFHNLRTTSSEKLRKERIVKNRPGSPCYKKFLSFDTEFTDQPICTASRQYQHLKLKQLEEQFGAGEKYNKAADKVMEKECLCHGLGASAIIANEGKPPKKLEAVTICPGPNLAYFGDTYNLAEMVGHIYGKLTLALSPDRPHVFAKELQLYLEHFRKMCDDPLQNLNPKHQAKMRKFKNNLINGIDYYTHRLDRIEKNKLLLKRFENLLGITRANTEMVMVE